MSMFGFLIFPTGEKYTRFIFEEIMKDFKITGIFRHRTIPPSDFKDIIVRMYRDIDPSKLDKAMAKIAAQGESTSFLWVTAKGHKDNIRPTKRRIRFHVGLNCLHTADNPESTVVHTGHLLGMVPLPTEEKQVNLEHVFDFSCDQFDVVCGRQRLGDRFFDLKHIFNELQINNINYAVVQMAGVSIRKNTYEQNKDIEIVCSDRTRAIDVLGAKFLVKPGMKQPHKGTYLVRIGEDGRKIKLDFSLSVFLPEKWRNRILATKQMGEEGIYLPQDQDTYWATMFERVIYKPRKFQVGAPKYAKGAEWEDLVRWGINMGLHPQIRLKTDLEGCQDAVIEYVERTV